jgi:hypothetical protein
VTRGIAEEIGNRWPSMPIRSDNDDFIADDRYSCGGYWVAMKPKTQKAAMGSGMFAVTAATSISI